MVALLTAARMRAVEKAAIDSGAVTGLELMERAGQGVVAAALEQWPDLAAGVHRAAVLCGPGNNGGDGFVVARLLKQRGWDVEVYLLGDPGHLPGDARTNWQRWSALGPVRPFPDLRPDPWRFTLIVDAGFGTGLSRPLDDSLMAAFVGSLPEGDLRQPDAPPFVVAVDVPTGLSSDTGAVLPAAVMADLTVTFHGAKLGHVLDRGPEVCGRLRTVDIGLDPKTAQDPSGPILTARPAAAALSKRPGAHKFGHGHALIVSGGAGRTGAARLAARGALRIGAGLVTLGVPPAARTEVASQITAIMLARVADARGLSALLEDDRLNALCLGPGLGLGKRAGALVAAALRARRPTVLDADALTLVAQDAALFGQLHAACVLTPHSGEFSRLFPDIAARSGEPPSRSPAFSKVDATRAAAARAGCIVLYKGPDTVIAAPDGRAAINASVYERAAPWLATAGSGDVLSGFVAGLLARGFGPMQAAAMGAWLHTECALGFGPGLVAEDLPEELPRVLRALGA